VAQDGRENLLSRYQQAVKSGDSSWKDGRFEEAFAWFSSARELAREMADAGKEVWCLVRQGRLCWPINRIDESGKFFSEALTAAARLESKKEPEEAQAALKAWELYAQGKEERLSGRYDESISSLSAAVSQAEKSGSPELTVKCLRQLSLAYWGKQDLEAFLALNVRALEIARKLNDQREQAKCLLNLGLYHSHLRFYDRALPFYSEALEISRALRNRDDESICLKNIGISLMDLGFYERSLDYLLAAWEIDKQSAVGNVSPQVLNNLGEAFRMKGLMFSAKADLYSALDFYLQGLDQARKNRDPVSEMILRNNIGRVHLDLGRVSTALHQFGMVSSLLAEAPDPGTAVELLKNIGVCRLRMGDYALARGHFLKALELGGQGGGNPFLWEVLYYLGECYKNQGDHERALTCYRSSVDAIDYLRSRILEDEFKAGFGRDKLKVYEVLVDLIFTLGSVADLQNRVAEVFRIVERAKARAFLETLGSIRPTLSSNLKSPLNDQDRFISGHITALIKKMARKNLSPGRRGELEAALRLAEDQYLEFHSRANMDTAKPAGELGFFAPALPVTLERAQAGILDEKTAILEYFLGENRSLLLLITKTDIRNFPLPPRGEVEGALFPYIKLLSDPPKGRWKGQAAGQSLFRVLLSEAMSALPESIENLIIIPDGGLFDLPFETLPLPSAAPSSEEELLISRYAVSYAASCSSLLFLKERRAAGPAPRKLLALANPEYPRLGSSLGGEKINPAGLMKSIYESEGFELVPLKQSRKEVQAIARFFPEEAKDIYFGRAASEETVKTAALENYGVIHLACHGYQDERVPFRSGLFLSLHDGQREDGLLQAREIAHLRLRAGLVVLSACRSSQGYIERGEGTMGLNRVLFYAGAQSVLSSLWEVGDNAAAEFMGRFYDHLFRGESKTLAVRSAKLRMLNSGYRHPFYWAAFVLHGDALTRIGPDGL
jgi:CHAT domain-containing protein